MGRSQDSGVKNGEFKHPLRLRSRRTRRGIGNGGRVEFRSQNPESSIEERTHGQGEIYPQITLRLGSGQAQRGKAGRFYH
jgi:hypothetical protein